MTFKELLDSVSYDEVERQIRSMYNYQETGNLGWYRMHFDMLRLLTPKHDDEANDDVCHITMEAMLEDIMALENGICGSCKSADVVYATDPSIGRQIRINYATFDSKYRLFN